MTGRCRWALGVASFTVLLIGLLTASALAESVESGATTQAGLCSEGCHEARPSPPPAWHTYHEGRSDTAAGPAGQAPTTLSLSPSSWALGAGEMVSLMAVLKGTGGAPVPGAEIRFYVDAAFAGSEGAMEIGRARTDANGVAFLDYEPTLSVETHKITARFEGTSIYSESRQAVKVQLVQAHLPAYHEAPIGLEAVAPWALATFLVALAGVWVAFGYIAYQGYAIARGL